MDAFFVCGGFVGFVAVVFGSVVALRWIKHREVMAMVEKGLLPGEQGKYAGAPTKRTLRGLMGWGIGVAAVGLALMIGLFPLGFVVDESYPLMFGPWMVAGLIPLFIGLALLIIYVLTKEEASQKSDKTEETEFPGE
jgi:hypothetical protein